MKCVKNDPLSRYLILYQSLVSASIQNVRQTKAKKQKQQKTAKYESNISPHIENMLRRKWQMAFASIMAQTYKAANVIFPAVWSFKQDDDKQRVGSSKQRKHDNGDNVRDGSHITQRKQCSKLKAWALTNPLPAIMVLPPFKYIWFEAGESEACISTFFKSLDSLKADSRIDMQTNTNLLRHAVYDFFLAVVMICLRFARFVVV